MARPARPVTAAPPPGHAQAVAATLARDWPRAAREWAAIAAQDTTDAEAALRLAEARFYAGEAAAAMASAAAAARLRPTDPRPRLVGARAARAALRFAPAAKLWQAVLKHDEQGAEPLAGLAEAELRRGHDDAGLHALARLLHAHDDQPTLPRLAATVLAGLPDARRALILARAEAEFAPALRPALRRIAAVLDPTDLAAQRDLAQFLLARAAHEAAIAPLRLLLAAGPEQPDLLRDLGRAWHRLQRWPDAIDTWLRLLRLAPHDFEAAFRAGQALRALQRDREALPLLRRALHERPADLAALREYSRGHARLGQPSHAEPAWQRALALHPSDSELRLGWCEYLVEQGRHEEADPIARDLAGPTPHFDAGGLALLRLMQARGEVDFALRAFAPQIADPPTELDTAGLEALLRCALMLVARHRLDAAAALLTPISASLPANPLAIRALLRLYLARANSTATEGFINRLLAVHGASAWSWREAIAAGVGVGNTGLAENLLAAAAIRFADHPGQMLDITESAPQGSLDRVVIRMLERLEAPDPAERLRAADRALRAGAIGLSRRLLGTVPGTDAIARDTALAAARLRARLDALDLPPGTETLALPDDAFALICRRPRPPRAAAHADAARIVMVTSSLGNGGAEQQLALTLRGIVARRGTAEGLHLLCDRFGADPARRHHLPTIQAAGIQVREIGQSVDNEARVPPDIAVLIDLLSRDTGSAVLALYREFRRLAPDVVHLWQDRVCVEGGLAAILAGVPTILLGTRSTRPASRERLRAHMREAFAAMFGVDGLLLCNNSTAGARDYEAWLGLHSGSVAVIPNGYEFTATEARHADGAAGALRAELGIPPSAPVLGGVMRLVEVKRPLLWIDVAAIVARRLKHAHVVLVGDGPLRDAAGAAAERAGLTGRLHMVGQIRNVGAYYDMMDTLLLTSATEGLPNVLIEAQAAGVPVVTTRVGGVEDALVEGVTGASVPSDDAKLLARAVLMTLEDLHWRARARREAPRFVRERFGAAGMIERTLALYGLPARARPGVPA